MLETPRANVPVSRDIQGYSANMFLFVQKLFVLPRRFTIRPPTRHHGALFVLCGVLRSAVAAEMHDARGAASKASADEMVDPLQGVIPVAMSAWEQQIGKCYEFAELIIDRVKRASVTTSPGSSWQTAQKTATETHRTTEPQAGVHDACA